MAIGSLPEGRGGGRPREDPRPPTPDLRTHDPADDLWNRWREAYPVIYETWRTGGDERACPVCGPLAGQEYEAGHGPMPPLHHGCRCERVTSRVEWRLR